MVVIFVTAGLGLAIGYQGVGGNIGVIGCIALGITLFFLILKKKVQHQFGTSTVEAVVVFLL